MKAYKNTDCSSWNCCDENLYECIDRSQFVKKIRKQLKEKNFKKNSDRLSIK
ncbi:MAG: hypothetical protein ACFFCE_15040 [Promethearchaeota archaeon]